MTALNVWTQSALSLLTGSQKRIQIILQNVLVASFVIAETLFFKFSGITKTTFRLKIINTKCNLITSHRS